MEHFVGSTLLKFVLALPAVGATVYESAAK